MGSALSVLFRIAQRQFKTIVPTGTTFNLFTDRPKGLLQLVVGRRVYPFLQLEASREMYKMHGAPSFVKIAVSH